MAKRLPKVLFPAAIASDYYDAMADRIERMHQDTISYLDSTVYPLLRMTQDDVRGDDWIDDIIRGLTDLDGTAQALFIGRVAEQMAQDFVSKVKTYGVQQVGRQVKAVLGFDPLGRDPKLEEVSKAAVTENVGLIKSIPTEYHKRVENVVLTGVRSGKSAKEIADEIKHVYDVTTSRAKLIAVDQAGKMMGDVTRIRQKGLGLTHFRWRDSNDNRVRPKHREFNGKVYSWDKGAPGGILPGQEVRCRCTAEVVEDELLDNWVPDGIKNSTGGK